MTTKIIPITCSTNETKTLFTDLDKPSLHALSYALRHPDTWPEGFVWDYRGCDHCAMGLAHALWQSIPRTHIKNGASVMSRQFAIPYGAAQTIFFGKNGAEMADWVPSTISTEQKGHLWWARDVRYRSYKLDAVTPEMVADQIDLYLATAE